MPLILFSVWFISPYISFALWDSEKEFSNYNVKMFINVYPVPPFIHTYVDSNHLGSEIRMQWSLQHTKSSKRPTTTSTDNYNFGNNTNPVAQF